MVDLYLKLLNYFNDVPIGTQKSISPFLLDHFKKPTANTPYGFASQMKDLNNFIKDVKEQKHLEFGNTHFWPELTKTNTFEWFDQKKVLASITIKGAEYLHQRILNNSVIEVNHSIAESNRIISKNTILQTKASSRQTYLLIATAVFTLVNLTISGYNIYSDKSKEQLRQQLTEQTKQIHALQMEQTEILYKSLKRLNDETHVK